MKLQQLQEARYDVKPNQKNLLRFKQHIKQLTKGTFTSATRTAYTVMSDLPSDELIEILSQQFGPPANVEEPDYDYTSPTTTYEWEVYFGTITAMVWEEEQFQFTEVTYNHDPAS